MMMTRSSVFFVALLSCVITGCSDRVIRSVVIEDGHMHPHRIAVPAETPFELTAAVIGSRGTELFGPSLGLDSLDVPNTWITSISPKGSSSPGSLRKVRTEIGPLSPGEYTLICACGGRNQPITIVVDQPDGTGTMANGVAANPMPHETGTP